MNCSAKRIGVIVNGATGGVVNSKHLSHVLIPIIRERGIILSDGSRLVLDLLLVGRNENRLKEVADKYAIEKWTTNLSDTFSDPDFTVYFDGAQTGGRGDRLKAALTAGKHVYTEKPVARSIQEAAELISLAQQCRGACGAVVDKIYLPGLRKLKHVIDSGFLDRILSVKLDFGYWIFDGESQEGQRPSWNYKAEEGGGLVLDMFPHWSYILHHLFGRVTGIFCKAYTHIPKRWDETGTAYNVDVEDAVFALMTLEESISVQLSTSWATRVRRSDLLTIQVDGTGGSAVATLHDCFCQSLSDTPRPYFDPVNPQSMDFFRQWTMFEDDTPFKHSFRYGWENFLRHITTGEKLNFDLHTGLEALQLIDAAYKSSREGHWINIEPVTGF